METFETCLAQFEPMISACMRKLHIYKNHADYIQSGRIALWKAWKNFDSNTGNFAAYAYRSIYGAMLDEMTRQNAYDVDEMSEDHAAPAGNETNHPEIPFEILPEKDRELLFLLYIEGKKLREVTSHFHMTEAALKKRKERALFKLRNAILTRQS
ncbi:sigma-70 family RNA polymerase sigma factor [Paenisporosarcina cavernae]|nr:sigma-70 family RNA polymerase sigma factor [Paenisporosarcina cavernae]